MPLSKPAPRKSAHERRIVCHGYEREDGLWDIDAHLVDVWSQPFRDSWRGEVAAGAPFHEMWLRLTVDEDIVIRAIEVVTDASPFPARCPAVPPNYQRLVGVRVGGGFIKEVQARIARTENCTHLSDLMRAAANCIMQTMYSRLDAAGNPPKKLKMFDARAERPAVINTCHAYAEDSPVVKEMWPAHYVGKGREQ